MKRFLSYLWINVANINSEIGQKKRSFQFWPSSKTKTNWNFTGCKMPHFTTVLIPYINLLNFFFLDKKCLFWGIWSLKGKNCLLNGHLIYFCISMLLLFYIVFWRNTTFSTSQCSAGAIFYFFFQLLKLDCLLFWTVYETAVYYWIVSSVILTFYSNIPSHVWVKVLLIGTHNIYLVEK